MKKLLLVLAAMLGLAGPVYAQGTIPVAMNIQQDANGRPLAGALLYLYVVGTLATPEIAFQDVNLTQALPWPIQADQVGRLPMFYLPAGSVHARLTDASGNVQFDYPNVLVIGGTSPGGGGGGPTVDPSTIATTGDIKYRLSSETLSGWVILNGQTIGNPTSGATFAPQDSSTRNLFQYLWTFCDNAHCPVTPGGRGATAIADFNASKKIQVLDLRSRILAGRDCMGNNAPCAGRLLSSNVTSGGGDGVDTAQATGGVANKTIAVANLPAHTLTVGGGGHSHGITEPNSGQGHAHTFGAIGVGGSPIPGGGSGFSNQTLTTTRATTGITINSSGANSTWASPLTVTCPGGTCAGTAFQLMNPFILATAYQKL